MTLSGATGAHLLESIRIDSDALTVDGNGTLRIDGIDPAPLLDQYGSPLFVTVERTVRSNYRRIRKAFTDRWPAPVNVMYSIKANNALAIRTILSSEVYAIQRKWLRELPQDYASLTHERFIRRLRTRRRLYQRHSRTRQAD